MPLPHGASVAHSRERSSAAALGAAAPLRFRCQARCRILETPADAPPVSGGRGSARFFILADPSQGGLHVRELAGGESFNPHAGRLGLFFGELGARDRVYPDQTATDFGGELLLL